MDDIKKGPGKWTTQEIEAAIKLLELSESVSNAAEKLGASCSSLRSAFRRRGLPSPSSFLNPPDENLVWGQATISVKRKKGVSWRTHLVIPDAHAKPGVSNDRFEWLGKLIVDKRPDVVVCIGDFADMESLSSYDKGKRSFEGRRYKKDVAAVIDAQERMFAPINCLNAELKEQGLEPYEPRFVMTLGNHENRVNRVVNDSPELDGIMSINDLNYEEFGWEVYPFLDRVVIDDIAYSHFFTSGVMNRPIGGEHAAASLVKKQFMSCTAGHSHLRDFAERTRADGTRIQGLVCGCFFDHEEEYATVANSLWWRGVVLKHEVQDGQYEPEFISIAKMKAVYSEPKTS